jgi:selenium-binding protein 1
MRLSKFATALALATTAGLGIAPAHADETCNSPYLSNLIKGQEDFLYVWTLGVKGMGDGFDKLVTLDVNPASRKYGQVVAQLSVGGRGEAHHAGFTDDRRFLWAGGLDDSKIYVFDIHSDPGKPKLARTIADFSARSGLVGPHTFHALPGRMLIGALSNAGRRRHRHGVQQQRRVHQQARDAHRQGRRPAATTSRSIWPERHVLSFAPGKIT